MFDLIYIAYLNNLGFRRYFFLVTDQLSDVPFLLNLRIMDLLFTTLPGRMLSFDWSKVCLVI